MHSLAAKLSNAMPEIQTDGDELRRVNCHDESKDAGEGSRRRRRTQLLIKFSAAGSSRITPEVTSPANDFADQMCFCGGKP